MLNLKKLRDDNKISQDRLSKSLGVSRSTIAMWETNGSQPDNDMLQRLADFFNVSVDYILGRTDEPFSVNQQLSGLDFALYGETKDLTDEEKQDILDYVRYKKSKK